jgi:hypothetical protein
VANSGKSSRDLHDADGDWGLEEEVHGRRWRRELPGRAVGPLERARRCHSHARKPINRRPTWPGTFVRNAAGEQLAQWGQREAAQTVRGSRGGGGGGLELA